MGLLRRILIGIVVVALAGLAYFYFGSFSEGVRSGIVVKISKKGYVFKTYEGQLNLLTFGAVRNQNMVNESFDFSVAGNREDIVKTLEEASLSGERVSLHYVERFATFPWRGDTRYFIERVERQNQKKP